MPRTALTVVTPKGPHPGTVTANLLDVTWLASDPANGNSFPFTGNELLLMRNSHATLASTVTIQSAPDLYGREADISVYSIEAGETAALLMTDVVGWRQTDGSVYLDIAGTGTILLLMLRIR